jgi:hypothetical protein
MVISEPATNAGYFVTGRSIGPEMSNSDGS